MRSEGDPHEDDIVYVDDLPAVPMILQNRQRFRILAAVKRAGKSLELLRQALRSGGDLDAAPGAVSSPTNPGSGVRYAR